MKTSKSSHEAVRVRMEIAPASERWSEAENVRFSCFGINLVKFFVMKQNESFLHAIFDCWEKPDRVGVQARLSSMMTKAEPSNCRKATRGRLRKTVSHLIRFLNQILIVGPKNHDDRAKESQAVARYLIVFLSLNPRRLFSGGKWDSHAKRSARAQVSPFHLVGFMTHTPLAKCRSRREIVIKWCVVHRFIVVDLSLCASISHLTKSRGRRRSNRAEAGEMSET